MLTRRQSNWIAAALVAGASIGGGAKAQVALPPAVEQENLARGVFETGVLSARDGALDDAIWQEARADDIMYLLNALPARPASPAIGEALRRVLLTGAASPADPDNKLGGAKLMALARLGFLEEARTIASLSSAPQTDPLVGQALALADMSEGKLNEACQRNARLSSGRDAPFWVKLRVACYVAAGETDAADLTYGLLKESGDLSDSEQVLLGALVAKSALKEPPAAQSAFDYTILRMLNEAATPLSLDAADAGVLVALARDPEAELSQRLEAGVRASAMGVLGTAELAALFKSAPADPAALAAAPEKAAAGGGVMTDALLYQSVQDMNAPEFLRDKASRIALALSSPTTFERAVALARLYEAELALLEGALLSPEEAGVFALAGMANRDADAAARWLTAMTGGGLAGLEERTAMRAIELVNLFSLIDAQAAGRIAARANIDLTAPRVEPAGEDAFADEESAALVSAALDAATDRIEGQAALIAGVASANGGLDSPLMRAVVDRSLRISSMPELADQVRFETAWSRTFTGAQSPSRVAPRTSTNNNGAPRLKPKANE